MKLDKVELGKKMRHAVDAALPEDEPNDVAEWVYEVCAKIALEEVVPATLDLVTHSVDAVKGKFLANVHHL